MMTKKRSAKHTFIASIVSMVLCLTMVIGTSLAWFTDTATNANNKIRMGELGIQLSLYIGQNDEEQEVWEDVSDKNEGYIFNKDKNGYWEPGAAEVVFLKVTNIKQLALEYNAALDVAVKNLLGGGPADISQGMEYAVIPGMYRLLYETKMNELANAQTPVTGWEAVKAIALEAEAEYNKDLPDGQKMSFVNRLAEGTSIILPEGELKRDESAYFALAVHMLPYVGNEFQKHEIVVDVRANAKQMAEEEDYFGDKYDIDSRYHEPFDGGLLANGGAEELELEWKVYPGVSVTYENFKDGNKSFRMEPASDAKKPIYMQQSIILDENKKYQLTFDIYIESEGSGETSLSQFVLFGGGDKSAVKGKNNEWTTITKTWKAGDKDVTYGKAAAVGFYNRYRENDGRVVYVDNIRLEEVYD